MKLPEIIQIDSPVLRNKSKEIPIEQITGAKIQDLISKMQSVLSSTTDGVALAAPQIGQSLRVFVTSEKAFPLPADEVAKKEHLVYVNPVLEKTSIKKDVLDEGCLSVRGKFGKIKRHSRATVSAYDEHGKKFRRGASGLLAEIFQHEIDHLEGILFVDTAWDVKEVVVGDIKELDEARSKPKDRNG